jgi:hypothetical protein
MDGSFILGRRVQMPYDVAVRQYLQGKGVASGDIGWDKNSGNVTVRNQPFYKPELNMAGTTYSNKNNLDNAYKTYSASQPVIQPDGSIGTTTNTGQPTGGEPQTTPKTDTKPASGGYTNPYTQMIGDLIKHLSEASNAPQQDIYSTPQYAAAKANQDRQSADSIRHASESAAGAGLGHSTIMTDRTQRIQNDSDQQLATQLVPQIQAQLEQQRQQELQNEQSQLNNYLALSDRSDNQHNADRTFDYNAGQDTINNKRNAVNDEATYKGVYNPSGQSVQDIQSQMDANSNAYATATPEEQVRLHDENIALGQQLGKTFDKKTGKYSEGQGFVGTKTVQAKQLDSQLSEVAYNHARDSLLDKRYEDKFNQDIKQQGFENALKIAVQQHQISNDAAQIAISQQNADSSKANSDWAQDPKNPDNIYKNKQIDKLDNPSLSDAEINNQYTADVVTNVDKMTPENKIAFFKNEKAALIKKLGKSGYDNLRNDYFNADGTLKE